MQKEQLKADCIIHNGVIYRGEPILKELAGLGISGKRLHIWECWRLMQKNDKLQVTVHRNRKRKRPYKVEIDPYDGFSSSKHFTLQSHLDILEFLKVPYFPSDNQSGNPGEYYSIGETELAKCVFCGVTVDRNGIGRSFDCWDVKYISLAMGLAEYACQLTFCER